MSQTTTDATVDQTAAVPHWRTQHGWRRAVAAFTRLRRTRPFWGGIMLAAGGYFVMRPLLGGSWSFYTHMGTSSMIPVVLGLGMIAAAAVSVVTPAQRHFPAIIAMMLSVASLPLANLGGWIIGMLLGIVGSGLVFAWTPYSDRQLARYEAKDALKRDRKAAKTALTAS
jgi:hypothetical protein